MLWNSSFISLMLVMILDWPRVQALGVRQGRPGEWGQGYRFEKSESDRALIYILQLDLSPKALENNKNNHVATRRQLLLETSANATGSGRYRRIN